MGKKLEGWVKAKAKLAGGKIPASTRQVAWLVEQHEPEIIWYKIGTFFGE